MEIDGKIAHEGQEEHYDKRQLKIEATGIAFVRFPARWVLRNPDEVANLILSICAGEIDIDDLDESLG